MDLLIFWDVGIYLLRLFMYLFIYWEGGGIFQKSFLGWIYEDLCVYRECLCVDCDYVCLCGLWNYLAGQRNGFWV